MPAIDEVLDELESHSDDINAFVILYIYYIGFITLFYK